MEDVEVYVQGDSKLCFGIGEGFYYGFLGALPFLNCVHSPADVYHVLYLLYLYHRVVAATFVCWQLIPGGSGF